MHNHHPFIRYRNSYVIVFVVLYLHARCSDLVCVVHAIPNNHSFSLNRPHPYLYCGLTNTLKRTNTIANLLVSLPPRPISRLDEKHNPQLTGEPNTHTHRWSAKPCVQTHHFVCQHNMPFVSDKDRHKVYARWNASYPNEMANEMEVIVDDRKPGYNTHMSLSQTLAQSNICYHSVEIPRTVIVVARTGQPITQRMPPRPSPRRQCQPFSNRRHANGSSKTH